MPEASMVIRGVGVAVGDVCFLYQPATLDFKFGNIEEFLDDSVRVSFPAQDWDRRAPAETFSLDEIIFAAELSPSAPPLDSPLHASEVVVRENGRGFCVAYGVLATQEDQAHPVVAVRVRLNDARDWTANGEPELLQPSKVYRPTTLARILRYIFCSPVHPLFDILRQRVGVKFVYDGPAMLELGETRVPVNAHMNVDGHTIDVHLNAHYQIASAMLGVRQTFDHEELVPVGQQDPPWSLSVAWNGASQHAEIGNFSGAIDVIPRSLTVDHHAGVTVATTALYVGAPMKTMSDLVWYRETPINPIVLMMGGLIGQLKTYHSWALQNVPARAL